MAEIGGDGSRMGGALSARSRSEMKELLGRPGSVSGLLLRVSQFSCAGIAIAVMVTTDRFAEFTCFCYLVSSMALQVLWSLGLACLDIYALSKKRDLQNKLLVRLFVVGDWVTATLSLAAASSSSGIAILFVRDFHFCTGRWGLPCGSYKLAVSFAFVTWILTSISSHVIIHQPPLFQYPLHVRHQSCIFLSSVEIDNLLRSLQLQQYNTEDVNVDLIRELKVTEQYVAGFHVTVVNGLHCRRVKDKQGLQLFGEQFGAYDANQLEPIFRCDDSEDIRKSSIWNVLIYEDRLLIKLDTAANESHQAPVVHLAENPNLVKNMINVLGVTMLGALDSPS
ncbi:unnamed protein product [Malus baccata var. baccata]